MYLLRRPPKVALKIDPRSTPGLLSDRRALLRNLNKNRVNLRNLQKQFYLVVSILLLCFTTARLRMTFFWSAASHAGTFPLTFKPGSQLLSFPLSDEWILSSNSFINLLSFKRRDAPHLSNNLYFRLFGPHCPRPSPNVSS